MSGSAVEERVELLMESIESAEALVDMMRRKVLRAPVDPDEMLGRMDLVIQRLELALRVGRSLRINLERQAGNVHR